MAAMSTSVPEGVLSPTSYMWHEELPTDSGVALAEAQACLRWQRYGIEPENELTIEKYHPAVFLWHETKTKWH